MCSSDLGALAFSWVFPERGEPQKEYRLTGSGYADLEEWERDIAIRKRHFDTFLERCRALRAGGRWMPPKRRRSGGIRPLGNKMRSPGGTLQAKR